MKLGLGANIKSSIDHDNYSILLNGSTQYANIDTVAGDIDTDKGTVSMWIKFSGAVSANCAFIRLGVDTSNNIQLNYKNSTEEFKILYKAGGVTQTATVSTSEEGDGNWTHLAMTWNTSADELKGYVNGSQVGGTQSSLGTWSGTSDTCFIGRNTFADDSYFKGYIDEVSIFDEVVSISGLYNSGNPTDVSGLSDLIGYWKMEEGTGTSIADSSGTGNTGTLVNTPTWSTNTP